MNIIFKTLLMDSFFFLKIQQNPAYQKSMTENLLGDSVTILVSPPIGSFGSKAQKRRVVKGVTMALGLGLGLGLTNQMAGFASRDHANLPSQNV